MERDKKEKVSSYEYAYKKKSTTVDKRALRLHRRSIEWKNIRGERLNSGRKLESLSPLQEISHNSTTNSSEQSYEEKTPTKSSENVQSSTIIAKENSKETQQKIIRDRLAKWREEKELKRKIQAQEKAKNKPFKVSHIDNTDLEKFDEKLKAIKATGPIKPVKQTTTAKICQAPLPRTSVAKTANITKSNAAKTSINSSTSVSKSSTKIALTTSKTKSIQKPVQPAPTAKPKTGVARGNISNSKGQIKSEQKQKEKKDMQIDLNKVSTSRGQSFAPEEFTFTAPSNLSSFIFRPLSPNTAASFLNPNQDAGASFLGTDPKRCSTPKSGDSIKKDINTEQSMDSEQTFKGDVDETLKANETVQNNSPEEPLRRSTRQKNLQQSDTVLKEPVRTRTRSQNKKDTSEEVARPRTRSTGRRLSQGKRTLDRSSSRRLSIGQDRSASRPRTRSEKAKDNTPVSVKSEKSPESSGRGRKKSVKRTRADNENNLSDDERATKRSKSVVVETSPKQSTMELEINVANNLPKNKSIVDLNEENDKTPKRKSMRLSRKSLAEAIISKPAETFVTKPSEGVVSSDDGDDVFKENTLQDENKNDTEPLETVKIVENNNVETPSRSRKSLRRSLHSKQVDDVFQNTPKDSKKQAETVDVVESKNNETPSCSRKSLRRSLHSKQVETNINIDSTPDVVLSPVALPQEPAEEINDENIPTKKMTRSTKRRSLSSLEGFAKPSADSVVLSSKRNATKKKRRKTVYDHTIVKSPEEWIKLLKDSPMVEMNRRTPKQKTPPPPALDFDLDIEELEEYNPSKVLNFSNCEGQKETSTEVQDVAMESNDVDQIEQMSSSKQYTSQELQVDEISTTQDSDKSDDSVRTGEHDVAYFRNLLQTETDRLNQLCQRWDDINNKTAGLSEDVRGQLRTVVGQGQLLIDQRFRQFEGLVDNCEFKQGEKETTCTDLEGFWEMIYFQVEDVNIKFANLEKLEANDWDLASIQPEIKVVKKKVCKAVVKKPTGKSKFAAFKAGMKTRVNSVTEDKTFDAGFFKVKSPVKRPSPHCAAGSPNHSEANSPKPSVTNDIITNQIESSGNTSVTNKSENNPPTVNTCTSDKVLLKTPLVTPLKRKSYVPNIPSPLLQDITPQPRTTRSSAFRKTPLPKNILSDVDDNLIMDTNVISIAAKDLAMTLSGKKSQLVSEVTQAKSDGKPRRRSTRTRKSVSFCDSVIVPPEEEEVKTTSTEDQDPFSKYLQPMTPRMSMAPKGYSVLDAIPSDDSFTTQAEAGCKLTFSPDLNTSDHNDSVTSKSRTRHSSLKQLPTRERRRSTRKGVQFISPTSNNIEDENLMHTPLSARTMPSNTSTPDTSDGELNRFSNLNVGFTPVTRSTRPSLLFTPPTNEDTSLSVTTDVPTAQLIAFTP